MYLYVYVYIYIYTYINIYIYISIYIYTFRQSERRSPPRAREARAASSRGFVCKRKGQEDPHRTPREKTSFVARTEALP